MIKNFLVRGSTGIFVVAVVHPPGSELTTVDLGHQVLLNLGNTLNLFSSPSPKDIIFSLLLEREKGEKPPCEREAPIGHLLWALCPWTRGQTCNLGTCPDCESNPKTFGYRTTLQPTEPHQPGLSLFYAWHLGQGNQFSLTYVQVRTFSMVNIKKNVTAQIKCIINIKKNVSIRAKFRYGLNLN